MKALTPEQLLIVADEFGTAAKVRVRSFAALAAAASVPGARFNGAPVFDSIPAAAHSLAATIRALQPLTAANDAFARVCAAVYLEWAERP